MSRYVTEFEFTDDDGDELHVSRDPFRQRPLSVFIGRECVEMFRPDVARLHAYLGTVLAEIPTQP